MQMRDNMAINLRVKRKDNQQLAYEFETCSGISKTAMRSYLKGEGNPRLDTIEQICETLGMTPNQLLLGSSIDQFLLEYVVPTISFVSEWPHESKINFVNLLIQMIEISDANKTPSDEGSSRKNHKVNNKAEALV